MEHANQQEERAGGRTVRQHLEYSALHGNILANVKTPSNHETKVADGSHAPDQLLQVGLHHCHERAINDADNRQPGHIGCGTVRDFSLRKQKRIMP